jgi:hypothetical protein
MVRSVIELASAEWFEVFTKDSDRD